MPKGHDNQAKMARAGRRLVFLIRVIWYLVSLKLSLLPPQCAPITQQAR